MASWLCWCMVRVMVRVSVRLRLRGYGCIGVCDVTPLPAHRAPALHTTQPLTRAKRAAMQTRWMCTLTEPLTAKIHTRWHLSSSGCMPVSSRAWTLCVEACIHFSGRKLGQTPVINQRTDEFCFCAFGAGRGRVRRVMLVGCGW